MRLFVAHNNGKNEKTDSSSKTNTTSESKSTTQSDQERTEKIDINTKGRDAVSKTAFMNTCVEGGKATMGAEKANSYCSCMLDKLQSKYPVEKASSIAEDEMTQLAKDCLQ